MNHTSPTRAEQKIRPSCKIAVIGAGLAGLATAVSLQRAGHKVTVFEFSSELKEIGAGINVATNATILFKEWSILPELEEVSIEPKIARIFSYKSKILSSTILTPDFRDIYKAPYFITHRAELQNVLYREAIRLGAAPNSTAYSWESNNCLYDPLDATAPYYPLTPPSTPSLVQNLELNAYPNASGILLFYVNNSTFRGDYNAPILLESSGNTSYPEDPSWNVYNFGTHTSIRLVIKNIFPIYHPIHLHGHDLWVLAVGSGEWDGAITNPSNPQRRDTILMSPGTPDVPSYLVIEYMADNPGVWPLHCHIGIHLSAGMLINTLERPDLVKQNQIPYVMAQTCRDWAKFSGSNIVDQIDSGL